MILRGIDFGLVWCASGAQGFFGEGYWYHRWWKPFGLSFDRATFVAKTTTFTPQKGNMETREDGITPKRLKPDCIVVKPFRGMALNAVGLTGPGAEALFADGRWQARTEPFFLSFMSVADTLSKRLDELNGFMRLGHEHLPRFRAKVGLQINFSCPNAGRASDDLAYEGALMLAHAAALRIPLVPKLSVTTPIEAAARIAEHPACDAVCISNTIPWAMVDAKTKRKFSRDGTSPLATYGGGGLSGAPLYPLVLDWVRRAKKIGFPKPINAGGGILSSEDAVGLLDAGADSIFIGSVAFLRPWRVASIITAARTHR